MTELTIRCLGAPEIEYQDTALSVDTRKAVALLIYLAVTGQVHTRDALAGLFWPESDQSSARGALRRTLSALRKPLGKRCLNVSRESLGLRAELELYLDVREFQRLLDQTKTHGHPPEEVCPACLPPLEQAARLYRDDFLAGFSLRDSASWDEWQFFEAERYRRELSTALDRLSMGYARGGNSLAALEAANRWLAMDELNETAHRRLMSLHTWSGRRDAALQQYRRCVRVLDQELGVPPLEETTELYQRILEQRAPLQAPTWPERTTIIPNQITASPAMVGEDLELSHPFPLVGRRQEREALRRAYAAVRTDGRFVLLEGEAGIGKSRLAEDFLAEIRGGGGMVLPIRCYEGEQELAFAPIMQALRLGTERAGDQRWWSSVSQHWLSEAARLAPNLFSLIPDLPPSPPLTGPGAQSRLLEGICQALVALCGTDQPGVLFFDDLHWADEATVSLISYLVRRLEGRPVLILASWRPDPGTNGAPAAAEALADLTLQADERLVLTRLGLEQIGELIAARDQAARPPAVDLADRLLAESEGLPLFVVEYLKALQEDEEWMALPEWPVPQSVRDLMLARIQSLSETALQALQTAAVIGRSFEEELLRVSSGRGEEEIVVALEELVGKGLLEEVGPEAQMPVALLEGRPTYDFSHEKMRSLAYGETSLVRRRLLHRRVAQALERVPVAGPPNPLAGQIAHHYHLAGQAEQSAAWYRLAGDHARSLYANADALSQYRSALALGHEDRGGLFLAVGELETLRGDYQQAISSFESAAALASNRDLALVEGRLGEVYQRLGKWELAEEQFQAALRALDATDDADEDPLRVRILADWSLAAHAHGDSKRALDLARQAERLSQGLEDTAALAQVHNLLGVLQRHAGELDKARASLEQSLELASRLEQKGARIAALNNLALTLAEMGEEALAQAKYTQALDLCQSLGDRHREAALHNNLADLLHRMGEREAAMEHLKQAVTLFADVGEEATEWQPEIWKLVEW